MKLISCYIENFGKITEKTYDFNDKITAFCEDNGYGKTTLANFIKAMFYGLTSYTKSTVKFVNRERYFPFGGGKFGGNITFEKNGDIYKIERFFGEKSSTTDTFKIYKNDILFDLDQSLVGKTFFGVDENAFSSTAFFGVEDTENISAESINAKLNNASIDDIDISKTLAILDQESKKYKKRTGGEIQDTKNRINELKAEVVNLKTKENILAEKYQELNSLKRKLREYDDGLSKQIEVQNELNNWNHYENALSKIEKQKEVLKEVTSKYNGEIPKKEDIDEVVNLEMELRVLDSEKRSVTPTLEDKIAHSELSSNFKNGVPSVDTMQKVYEDSLKVNEYKKNENIINRKFGIFLITISAITMLSAIPIYLIGHQLLGLVLFLIGTVGLIPSLYLNARNTVKLDKIKRQNEEIERIKNNLCNFFTSYGIASGDFTVDHANLTRKIEVYRKLDEIIIKSEIKLKEIDSKRQEICVKLDKIYQKFGLSKELSPDGVRTVLSNHKLKVESEKNRLESYIQDAEEIKTTNNLTEKPLGAKSDFDAYSQEVVALRNQVSALQKEIEQIESEVELLPEKTNQIQELNDKLIIFNDKLETVNLATEYILKADKNLNDKFVAPIKNKFENYLKIAGVSFGNTFSMDRKYNVSYENHGELHSIKHLSSGEYTLSALALRLAFIDIMYTDDNPFIILDDPFVNLDETHLTSVIQILKKLSEEKQIIYFTCHSSRNV